jgi:hypothetical protein
MQIAGQAPKKLPDRGGLGKWRKEPLDILELLDDQV